ncbi:hypothetical protein M758_1G097400 [Ceratodon purpureus]|nr:hypothetical protein M758_1G097400 [Ceratodon purpureus]
MKQEQTKLVALEIMSGVSKNIIEVDNPSGSIQNHTKLASIDVIDALKDKWDNRKQKSNEVVAIQPHEVGDATKRMWDPTNQRHALLAEVAHDMINDKLNEGKSILNSKEEGMKLISNNDGQGTYDVAELISDDTLTIRNVVVNSIFDARPGALQKVVDAKSNVKWDQTKETSSDIVEKTESKVVDSNTDATLKSDQPIEISSHIAEIVVDKIVDAKDGISAMYKETTQTSLEVVQAEIDMFKEAKTSTSEVKFGHTEKDVWEKAAQAKRISDEKTNQAMRSLADKFGEANAKLGQKVEAIVDKAKQVATTIGDATKEVSFNVVRVAAEKVGPAKGNVNAPASAPPTSGDVSAGATTSKN